MRKENFRFINIIAIKKGIVGISLPDLHIGTDSNSSVSVRLGVEAQNLLQAKD